jgi:hypothetical protein
MNSRGGGGGWAVEGKDAVYTPLWLSNRVHDKLLYDDAQGPTLWILANAARALGSCLRKATDCATGYMERRKCSPSTVSETIYALVQSALHDAASW